MKIYKLFLLGAVVSVLLFAASCEKNNNNPSPRLTLISPNAVDSFKVGKNLVFSANAYDADGLTDFSVSLRERHKDTIVYSNTISLSTGDYTFIDSLKLSTLYGLPFNTYDLTFSAHDSKGAVDSLTATFRVKP